MTAPNHRHPDQLRDLLRTGVKPARVLADALGVSQPTVSRALQALGPDVLRIGAARSIQYVLRDPSRVDLVAPVYRVTAEGRLHDLGTLVPVYPEGFVMVQADGVHGHTDGLPWWLFDMRPQGYLGRAYNQRHGPALGLPERLTDWNDSHVMRALLRQGGDLPGNLLMGDAAQQAFLNASQPSPIALAGKAKAYAALALAASRGEHAGSSAGGEQPKFTAYAQLDGGEHLAGEVQGAAPAHVIVKFSSAVPSPVSARWRDLLLAEHLALQVLRAHGIASARTHVLDHGGQRFLEVERFDRVGALGRRALHSLTALDAEFVGNSGRWPEMVGALAREGVVVSEAVDAAGLLWAFGILIGNTDMHSGNLSFMAEHGRPYQLAPVYDMTPMAFAPTAAGDVPVRRLELVIGSQVAARTWRLALPLAQDFVGRLAGLGKGGATGGFSEGFAACVDALRAHVAQAEERIDRLA